MASNDVFLGMFVYIVSCISLAIGQESKYLKDYHIVTAEVLLVQ